METSTDPGARESAAPNIPPLDMTKIAAQALGTAPKLRAWSLEYLSEGITFKWAGYGETQQAADRKARQELHDLYPAYSRHRAQLVAAIEV